MPATPSVARNGASSKHRQATNATPKLQLLPKKRSEQDQKLIYIAPAGTRPGGLQIEMIAGYSVDQARGRSLIFETIWDGKDLLFSISSGGAIITRPLLIGGSASIIPPKDAHGLLRKQHVLLPSAAIDYDSEEDLDQSILDYLRRYIDAPEFELKLMRAYAKMTWVFDAFRSVPYLRFLGPWQSGKSRRMEVVGWICYRGIPISGSMSGAPLFRLMDLYGGTLLIDEADFKKSDETTDVAKILNDGYRRGMPVYRCNKEQEPIPYDPFGPKILTTRHPFGDIALESRCLTLESIDKPVSENIPHQLPSCFDGEAEAIRNKLLTYRFRTYFDIKADESQLRSLDSRQCEIAIPLMAVTQNDPDFQDELRKHLEARSVERRQDSHEATFVLALRTIVGDKPAKSDYEVTVKQAAQKASELRIREEPEAARQLKDGQFIYSAKRAGRILRDLGFDPKHARDGAKFTLSVARLGELERRYPPPEKPGLASTQSDGQKVGEKGLSCLRERVA